MGRRHLYGAWRQTVDEAENSRIRKWWASLSLLQILNFIPTKEEFFVDVEFDCTDRVWIGKHKAGGKETRFHCCNSLGKQVLIAAGWE